MALSLGLPCSLSALPLPTLAAEQSIQKTTLSPAQATKTAQILLKALAIQDAKTIYAQLSGALHSTTTIEGIQQRLENRPRVVYGNRIIDVSSGLDDTTVKAMVMTSKGDIPLVMVLDERGKLIAWEWSDRDLAIEQSAIDFVDNLASKRWISARSLLELSFQQELKPEDLQRKWTKLDRVTGGFKKVENAIVASQGGEQQLVLVTIQFGNLTDNLFVIFNSQGKIINVDFSPDLV
ncbi:MAG: DUF3887 domain-containing protein [Prochlorococcus sp.]|nr:DUF3887 domain-containing protein [Prochlorococcaceae cyanobacterium Fu_MAG_72]|tara:strand:- start:145 stop:852 length:708 start_codon:yes stop_codon:yes gene_type:complete